MPVSPKTHLTIIAPVGPPSTSRPISNLPADYDCRTAHDDLSPVGRLIAHAGGGAAPDQHGRRSFDDDVRRPYANGGIAHTRCGHISDKDMRAAGRKYRPAHMRNRWEPRRLHGTHMHISNARCWRHGPSSFTPIRRVADNAFSLHHTGRSQPLVDFHQTALDLQHCLLYTSDAADE